MNTDFIQELGLKRSIELEINRLQKMTKKDVEYIEGPENKDVLDKNQQLMAYRIFQEILNNAIKHSGATQYSIRSFNQAYLLQVEDNGQGFSTDEVNYSFKASGLTNMKKRASLANMQLDIETAPNKGCIITLKLLDQE
jgi:signal transduction histidine kinase